VLPLPELPELVPPELPLDAEPPELEPLPEPEPALSVLEPHEKTRPTAMAATTEEASVIAVVGKRVILVLLRCGPPAAHQPLARPIRPEGFMMCS
jgi:hypothetical protein